MKTTCIKQVLFIAATAMLGSKQLYAQATATASVSATVIAPVSLAKNVDLNFGNAAVSAGTGGVVILSTSSTRSTTGGGVTLPVTAGTVSAANFTVSGAPGYTYAITLPSSATITGPSSATMTVSSFNSTPAATGTLNAGGTQTLTVGASLTVAAGQRAGSYTNATAVPVTVNYN